MRIKRALAVEMPCCQGNSHICPSCEDSMIVIQVKYFVLKNLEKKDTKEGARFKNCNNNGSFQLNGRWQEIVQIRGQRSHQRLSWEEFYWNAAGSNLPEIPLPAHLLGIPLVALGIRERGRRRSDEEEECAIVSGLRWQLFDQHQSLGSVLFGQKADVEFKIGFTLQS